MPYEFSNEFEISVTAFKIITYGHGTNIHIQIHTMSMSITERTYLKN